MADALAPASARDIDPLTLWIRIEAGAANSARLLLRTEALHRALGDVRELLPEVIAIALGEASPASRAQAEQRLAVLLRRIDFALAADAFAGHVRPVGRDPDTMPARATPTQEPPHAAG
ncbi:hypothetical protein [Rubellimicrobium aerolatum]|uniref:Uncharacterized protein n=1 Tax=Rubellimicrobium aerolatum TaxID=490979 RepID=A0ABW0SF25_9RHOB|nr:hypothetical protein [Rubellimicrobium aerolatum]MBP1806494.1 hypothetical protein [Rubellimicrobium aerolatum]